MIPDLRQQIVSLLAELAELAPDVRMGQMLSFVGVMGEDETGRIGISTTSNCFDFYTSIANSCWRERNCRQVTPAHLSRSGARLARQPG